MKQALPSHLLAVAAIVLLLLFSGTASAQRACDKFVGSTTTGATALTEKIPAVAGQRIYLCGYLLMPAAGPDLQFSLLAGTGVNCASNQTAVVPQMPIPPGGIVNRSSTAGEMTPASHALCLQTFGTGTLTAIFYWAQF